MNNNSQLSQKQKWLQTKRYTNYENIWADFSHLQKAKLDSCSGDGEADNRDKNIRNNNKLQKH